MLTIKNETINELTRFIKSETRYWKTFIVFRYNNFISEIIQSQLVRLLCSEKIIRVYLLVQVNYVLTTKAFTRRNFKAIHSLNYEFTQCSHLDLQIVSRDSVDIFSFHDHYLIAASVTVKKRYYTSCRSQICLYHRHAFVNILSYDSSNIRVSSFSRTFVRESRLSSNNINVLRFVMYYIFEINTKLSAALHNDIFASMKNGTIRTEDINIIIDFAARDLINTDKNAFTSLSLTDDTVSNECILSCLLKKLTVR